MLDSTPVQQRLPPGDPAPRLVHACGTTYPLLLLALPAGTECRPARQTRLRRWRGAPSTRPRWRRSRPAAPARRRCGRQGHAWQWLLGCASSLLGVCLGVQQRSTACRSSALHRHASSPPARPPLRPPCVLQVWRHVERALIGKTTMFSPRALLEAGESASASACACTSSRAAAGLLAGCRRGRACRALRIRCGYLLRAPATAQTPLPPCVCRRARVPRGAAARRLCDHLPPGCVSAGGGHPSWLHAAPARASHPHPHPCPHPRPRPRSCCPACPACSLPRRLRQRLPSGGGR